MAALALGVVGAAVWLMRTPEAPPADDARVTRAKARRAQAGEPASFSESSAPDDETPKPQRPLPDCWAGLERFQGPMTLDEFRAALRPLLDAQPQDALVLRYLEERLSELIGGDEAKGLALLQAAQTADSAELSLLLGALRNSDAVHTPGVAQKLTQLALDGKMDLERRQELLQALDTQRRLSPKAIEGLAAFAKDENAGDAAVVATRTLGRVMAEDFKRTGNASAYLDKLLSLAKEAPEEAVRSMALEMPMVGDIPTDAKGMDRLSQLLKTDPSENVRELAAHDLALGEDKAKALQEYESAFQKENELCVRWALFRFAARAAGPQALPLMQRMAGQDGRFQSAYDMFAKVYGSGVVDFERVWLALDDQDPVGCLHEDGDDS